MPDGAAPAFRVGVAGLGRMGLAFAERLASCGVRTAGWNRSPGPLSRLEEIGVAAATDLRALWEASDVVVTSLADDDAVESVALGAGGLLATAPAEMAWLETSTISPAASGRLAERAAAAGVAYLRCPVSGNPGVVLAGDATLIVSGERDVYDSLEPLLSLIGANRCYVGPGEEARVVKLAINSILVASTEALAEAVLLADVGGVERETFLEVLGRSVLSSRFFDYKGPALLQRDYGATFTTDMLSKDLRLLRGLAGAHGVTLPMADLLAERLEDTSRRGFGDVDFMALLLSLQALNERQPDAEPG